MNVVHPGGQKAVLVTGCSSGIGRAVALHLASTGYTVFATVRKESDLQNLKQIGLPGLVGVCPVDMRKPEEITAAVEQVASRLDEGGLTLYAVINNAGGGSPAPVELIDPDMLRGETQTRIVGPVVLLQAALPLLRAGAGRVLWIVTPAIIPTPYVAAIHACDFAANCLARTLDIELKRWGIPNVMIRCGGIRTPAGLRTSDDVSRLLESVTPERAALYAPAMHAWAEEMTHFDRRRIPAEQVAHMVAKALSAPRPRRRYSLGHMVRLAALLELFPQPLADAILKRRF